MMRTPLFAPASNAMPTANTMPMLSSSSVLSHPLLLLAIVTRQLQLHPHQRIHHNGISYKRLCWEWHVSFQLSVRTVLVTSDFTAAVAPFAFLLDKFTA